MILEFKSLPIATSPQKRTLRILLPDDYHETNHPCRVLYMHDGQNLFEDKTAYGKESWRVYEAIQSLKINDLIVVGIDNSDLRMFEYSPWPGDALVTEMIGFKTGGLGDVYARFVIDQVKPLIDQTYRTLPDRAHTMIAGSSMGAFISVYMATMYPETFSIVGCFSLASWFNEKQFLDHLRSRSLPKDMRFFISIGSHETSNEKKTDFDEIYLNNSRNLKKVLLDQCVSDIYYIETEDIHHESAWRKLFPTFLKWIDKRV